MKHPPVQSGARARCLELQSQKLAWSKLYSRFALEQGEGGKIVGAKVAVTAENLGEGGFTHFAMFRISTPWQFIGRSSEQGRA